MKTIIVNNDNMTDNDIKEIETRVKAILINDNNEILMGHSYDTYQFIGGHVENNEDLLVTLSREIKEEAGIEMELKDIEPISLYTKYKKEESKKLLIYYYVIHTNELPNRDNTNYTDDEVIGDFDLKYIKVDELRQTIIDSSEYNKLHSKYEELSTAVSKEILLLLDTVGDLSKY